VVDRYWLKFDLHRGKISRVKNGKQFRYYLNTRLVKDKATLQRIQSLSIPPAWEGVWICKLENGHLQATGKDAKKRKQYIYHSQWHSLRNQAKFYSLIQFGNAIPAIRAQVEKDLALPGIPVKKVLALVVKLMEHTSIRVGSTAYEKLYGSFGLTTLKDKHATVSGSNLKLVFKGKKGITHEISIRNKKLARMVKACRDIPGQELFQYYDVDGSIKSIDSGMVNNYIKEICGGSFTAKDFRTWTGTILAFSAFKKIGAFESMAEAKRNILDVLDIVSKQLGNTRTVCKKYYVHPILLSMYEAGRLATYFSKLDKGHINNLASGLSAEEQMVIKILKSS
jgi:DNA topoisomerase-1